MAGTGMSAWGRGDQTGTDGGVEPSSGISDARVDLAVTVGATVRLGALAVARVRPGPSATRDQTHPHTNVGGRKGKLNSKHSIPWGHSPSLVHSRLQFRIAPGRI